jgi:hypothetical protein
MGNGFILLTLGSDNKRASKLGSQTTSAAKGESTIIVMKETPELEPLRAAIEPGIALRHRPELTALPHLITWLSSGHWRPCRIPVWFPRMRHFPRRAESSRGCEPRRQAGTAAAGFSVWPVSGVADLRGGSSRRRLLGQRQRIQDESHPACAVRVRRGHQPTFHCPRSLTPGRITCRAVSMRTRKVAATLGRSR